MAGLYRKHLPKLYLLKENSRLGATALPSMANVNVGPCFTWQNETRERNKGEGEEWSKPRKKKIKKEYVECKH